MHEVRHAARTGWRRRRRPSVLVLAVAQMRRFFAEGRVSFARGRAGGLYRREMAPTVRGRPLRLTGGKTYSNRFANSARMLLARSVSELCPGMGCTGRKLFKIWLWALRRPGVGVRITIITNAF